MRELWDHQAESLTALRQTVAQGVRRIVLQAPTGAGKTILAAAIIEGAQRKNNRTAFVVSHISLVDQTMEEFYKEGIQDIGVIQANHFATDWSKPVQICSIQTLRSRGAFPEAKTVIFDEVHALHQLHKQWLKDPAWAQVPFIGLSATPWAKGLGNYFDTLLVAATTKELIDKKLLSKFRVFATGHPDLSMVKTVAGDYHEGQLSDAMQAGELTADIIRTWRERHGLNKTLLFAVDLAHAQALQQRFIEAGISCGYQDAGTTSKERAEIKRKFHNGEYRVVCNVGTLTTGVDWDVRCLILARPTKSEMLFCQIIGRALRTAEGKDYALILDHSDTTSRLGFVTDIHHEHLLKAKDKPKAERKAPLPRPCPKCDCLLPYRDRKCLNCGNVIEVPISGYVERNGELIEILPGMTLHKAKGCSREYTMAEKERWLAGFKGIATEKGYKPGWAARQFKEKFGVWPHHTIENIPANWPTMEVRMYIKSRMIAWAKSKRRLETV